MPPSCAPWTTVWRSIWSSSWAHPHITVYEDGALRYEIYRISGAEGDSFTLPVPNPASVYQASLDNLGGVVLAYTYN